MTAVEREAVEHLEQTLSTLTNWYAEQAEQDHQMFAFRRGQAQKAADALGMILAEGPPHLVPLAAGEVDGIAFYWPLTVTP